MNLYLSGGVDNSKPKDVEYFYETLKDALMAEKPNQFLHIPFARTGIYAKNREACLPDAMRPFIESLGIEFLDGRYLEEYEKALTPMIFMNGGNDPLNLHKLVTKNSRLNELIMNAPAIFGDSSGAIVQGAMVQGLYEDRDRRPALNLVPSLIMPHFTEWDFKKSMLEIMTQAGQLHGTGIDELTVMKTTRENPLNYTSYGKGGVAIYDERS